MSDWFITTGPLGEFGPYLYILIAGVFATYIWRFLGVVFAGDLDENSEPIRWVKAVATALIAGVIARLILFPVGDLATTPVALRLAAVIAGSLAFLAARQNVLVGIMVAEVALIGGWWLLNLSST